MESLEELGQRWQSMFRVLAAGTRRQIIGSLLEAPPERTLSLPEAANLPEYRVDPAKLQIALVHDHLPMMAAAGYVEWDREPFTVSRGPRFEEVAAVLLAIEDYDDFPQHLIENCYFHGEQQVNP